MFKKAATIVINDVDLGGSATYFPEKNEVLKGCAYLCVPRTDLYVSLIVNDIDVLIDSFELSQIHNKLSPDDKFIKLNIPLVSALKFKATSAIPVTFDIFIKTEIESNVC